MLEASNDLKNITPLMRYAADYFEENRTWNKMYKKSAQCPACGGATEQGRAIHSCGAVLDWPLAISFGLKTRAQAAEAGIDLNGNKQPGGDVVNKERKGKR
jgi:hypothetical protein